MEPITEIINSEGEICFQLAYNAEKNYLYGNWIGYVVKGDCIAGSEAQMRWAAENAAAKEVFVVVNDNSQLRGSWDMILPWVEKNWRPSMEKSGLRGHAMVSSPDLLTQVTAEGLQAGNAPGPSSLETRIFGSLKDAEQFVEKLHKKYSTSPPT